jgi:DNA-binding MarR family transcriptional regulator
VKRLKSQVGEKSMSLPAQDKFKKLSPELTRFIESMGLYFESSGIPRIGGRILGVLMIAHDALSADDIAKILKVSRASLSTNLRMLTASRLVEKTSVLHDRTTYYVFPDASLEQRMLAGIQSAVVFKKVTEQGLAALPADDSARIRMNMSIEWSDLLVEHFEEAIAEWRKRYPDLPHK